MKKSILLSAVFFAMSLTICAQWSYNDYGIYPNNLNKHLSIKVATPNTQMDFTLNGQQIIYGAESTLLFGGLENTDRGWGEYGIEYNVSASGLNFWKPYGHSYNNGSTENWILFLKDDGRVGIGTYQLTKGFILTVAGGINAREILVTETAGGADFVFEEDFELRSIAELEAFVNQNNHLPDIPSAKEMEENGLNMGEFQILLLQKVEELTLYVIEQQKEIEQLKLKMNSNEN